jgi:hypothetical protein
VSLQLLDDPRAAKHGSEHDGRHPDAVVGVNVRAVFEQQGYDFLAALEGVYAMIRRGRNGRGS